MQKSIAGDKNVKNLALYLAFFILLLSQQVGAQLQDKITFSDFYTYHAGDPAERD